MGLLDGFEKLINEHGSSTILRERISLINDKYATLEKKVSEIQTENERLKLDNSNFTIKCRGLEEHLSNNSALTNKYGAYWDKDGNSYCPKCKTPTSSTSWTTYMKRQIRGLKCPCSEKPFILMKDGEPIHAQDAMKEMVNA
ncbi:MAG: hypothetical protein Q9M24_09265 [Mariprofundaceae bacterium]|nr:hypothetical protein [Mariprofundaceae bacterium]